MDNPNKTRDELLRELQKLRMKYDQFKSSYEKDIAERDRAEEKLLVSEEKFRKAFITSPDSININRITDGMYISINQGFTKITGYTEEEVIGKTSIELNLWADPADRDNLVKGLKERGEVENLEARFLMKNGNLRNGIMSATVIDLDGVPHILSITRDITDRKVVEEKLRKSEEKYRLLAENISDVIWILDTTSMHFIYVSPSVERLRGYTAEEVIAQPVTHALKKDVSAYMIDLTKSRAEDVYSGREVPGKFYINEVEQPCKDGSFVWTEVITSYYINPHNGRVEVLGVTRDITDRKQAEVEVKKLNARLEERVNERTKQLAEANSELQAFAYSVSHDLRAPLRAIDGFSRFVLEDYSVKLDSEGQRLLGLIRSNTKKMDKLITDILSLSRVTRSEHKKAKVDMTKMALSMFNEAASPEIQERLEFIIEDLPESYADPTLIKQVWINLISNAIKFSSLKMKPEIKIGGSVEDGFNIYYVRDNGVGFNPDYAHKLFGVFQRLHQSNEFEGSGVGLAIVERIIYKHGGKVWAEGNVGQGAIFYFSLPAKA